MFVLAGLWVVWLDCSGVWVGEMCFCVWFCGGGVGFAVWLGGLLSCGVDII